MPCVLTIRPNYASWSCSGGRARIRAKTAIAQFTTASHNRKMRTQLRIVAGSLRGRKLTFIVAEDLRPIPDMVRQALFSILGNAVPGGPFLDLFAAPAP